MDEECRMKILEQPSPPIQHHQSVISGALPQQTSETQSKGGSTAQNGDREGDFSQMRIDSGPSKTESLKEIGTSRMHIDEQNIADQAIPEEETPGVAANEFDVDESLNNDYIAQE
jgi:hypothetical protein